MSAACVADGSAYVPQLARFMAEHGIAEYDALVARADADPEWFWPAVMSFNDLRFFTPFTRLLDLSRGREWPDWCIGGTTNIAHNCLDRTLARGLADKAAILWEGEDGARRTLSYGDLHTEAARAADGLRTLGIGPGDVVGLYMPSVPEAITAFLAVMGIGAIALPMFSGFGPQALTERLVDAGAKAVITADVTMRRGKSVAMAEVIEAVRPNVPTLHHVIVAARDRDGAARPGAMTWRDLLRTGREGDVFGPLPAETPAMLVYTSGTTGKPKGTVHTHCGFMTKVALDFGIILDLTSADRLLWMSDMGWLTGPILAVATPLVGATVLLAEGVPDYPEPGRLWRLVQDHRITFLGVAPTMVRAFMQQAPEIVGGYDLSSLRVTAATGEPWNPEAWTWFRSRVCGGRAPILNYSGGTEIGGGIVAGHMLRPDVKPCAFAGPIPGMGAAVVDEAGRPVPAGQVGELVLRQPSIGLTRGVWGSPERYLESYWSKIPGLWAQGDFAVVDGDGEWFIQGRSDDIIKIAGKRTGPAEIEALLIATGRVAEAAAIGVPDDLKGSSLVCVCVPAQCVEVTAELERDLREAVVAGLGASFRPKGIVFVDEIPKTRSLKIMRRVVRSLWLGEPPGDLSGLVNPEAVEKIAADLARARA